MNFELGKEYIVKVSEEGIIPIEEFKSDRFYDKDHDDLDFLTNEEKKLTIDQVLCKIEAEINAESAKSLGILWERTKALEWVLNVIGKYKAESEEGK